MTTKCLIQSVIIASLFLLSSPAYAQYEEEPFIEAFVGGNLAVPIGYIKNDLDPDSLNAKAGLGFDIGAGYYLSNKMIAGVYFNVRNMGVKDLPLKHRVFEFGAYGKYLFRDLSEVSLSPYIKLSAGLNFSKLATRVLDDGQPVYRELSYSPTLGTEANLGLQWRTNSYGGIYIEAAYHFDFMNDVTGDFESTDYVWGDNNNFILFKAGVLFNIGPKE